MALDNGRFFHVNVNCSDLERSRRFYVDGLGLEAAVRTAAGEVQPGAAFGLERAQWDAWILLGPRGFEGGAIDLLEWQEPAPRGTPPSGLNQCGYQRVGILVPDLDAAIAGAHAHGGATWSDPLTHSNPDGSEIRIVLGNDPDGTALELVESDGPRTAFAAIACADLEASIAFYRALGFRDVARFPSTSDDGAHLHLDGRVEMEEVLLLPPTKSDMYFMLVGFSAPPPVPSPPRPANTLGMWRSALLVTDLDAAYAELGRLGITTLSPPTALAMGPGLPELRFVCFPGPDGEIVELIEQPAE